MIKPLQESHWTNDTLVSVKICGNNRQFLNIHVKSLDQSTVNKIPQNVKTIGASWIKFEVLKPITQTR